MKDIPIFSNALKFGKRRAETPQAGPSQDGTPQVATPPVAAPQGVTPQVATPQAGTPPGAALEAFARLGLAPHVLAAIAEMGYTVPTPIQEEAIPVMLSGSDLVGQAQTGTGKTLVFGATLAQLVDPTLEETQVIVLTPTRELANQVTGVVRAATEQRPVRVVSLFGGHKLQADFDALRRPPHVVVGTPGRVADHLERRTLDLSKVRLAVLDEADQMLDIGFAPAIDHILSYTPRRRQTALFSATMPPFIRRMIRRHMRDPRWIQIAPEEATVDAIEQVYYEVSDRDKVAGLMELIKGADRMLVFRRTQRGVDDLARALERRGVRAFGIHGGLEQGRREQVLQAFRNGSVPILIATNVASRGLDIDDVSHVVNYDLPQNLEEYIHRIGRTGRAGKTGIAVSFVGEWELGEFDVIHARFGDALKQKRLALYGG
ncbi:MAG: DEAD/DEAH box helicase [Dehalococcoidia bacterium]|nr:DEAD/DEAH box helicase [Dehalococcoidia bacterium]